MSFEDYLESNYEGDFEEDVISHEDYCRLAEAWHKEAVVSMSLSDLVGFVLSDRLGDAKITL